MLRIFKPKPKKKKVINPDTSKKRYLGPNNLQPKDIPTQFISGKQGIVLEKGTKIKKVINPEIDSNYSTIVTAKKNIVIPSYERKEGFFPGGPIKKIVNSLVNKINKLHKKQQLYGLTKAEKIRLGQYQAQLRNVVATREGTKIKRIKK